MAVGSGLSQLAGYPFEVRYSAGSLVRARAAADVAANAYVYFSCKPTTPVVTIRWTR
jgi:hypothetical protein